MPSVLTCLARQGGQTSLGRLRRLLGLPQIAIGLRLGVSQPHIAQIEGQPDMYVSTLRRYVKALGGELELIARFPDQRIEISLTRAPTGSPHQPISQQPSGGNHASTIS